MQPRASSSSSSPPSSSSAPSSGTPGELQSQAPVDGDSPIPAGTIRETGYAKDRRTFYFPAPDRPVDPWVGVAGGKPLMIQLEAFWWSSRPESFECTAARDHCLPAASWMWFPEAKLHMEGGSMKPFIFTQQGATRPANLITVPTEGFVAYRTVPVTRKTLVVGARIAAQPAKPVPVDPWDDWHVGTVTRVDWEMGFVNLSTSEEPYWITAARLPVLMWDPSKGVQILGGKSRDTLAVDARDVVLP